jgi:hypothetical protein
VDEVFQKKGKFQTGHEWLQLWQQHTLS